jgi:MFS family permease
MLVALFVLTFVESIAATLIQRGLYFYTHEQLGFTQSHNLWLAFGFGVTYIAGAMVSHGANKRLGERGLLLVCLAGLLLLHAAMAVWAQPLMLVTAVFGTAFVQGLKWPVVESYVSAGRPPKELLSILGRYNVTWAIAGFAAVGVTGLIVDTGLPSLFFWLPAALNLIAIVITLGLPASPRHLDHAHPERPAAQELSDIRALLGSARWAMIGSYALLYVLAPLMPSLLDHLGLSVTVAAPVASLLDAVRVVSFGLFGWYAGWHGKRLPMWLTAAALPAGFLTILLGDSLPLVILGELIFGGAAGFAYTAALYYALVADNASVDAGGAHESLIGIGIGLGPLSGLAGQLLVGQRVPFTTGTALGPFVALALTTLPIMAVCTLGSLRPLLRLPGRGT